MTRNASDPVDLTSASLGSVDARIRVPTYDRAELSGGIVHIGVGGFHRAHQAVYLDDLCSGGLTGWSIVGSGVLPGDSVMADALASQDYLYSLITRDETSTDVRIIGSITGYVLATPSLDELIQRLAEPSTRIVSLTITEGGYPVDEHTGAFTAQEPGAVPPAFSAIVRALRRRRDGGRAGFTVMSCDNITHNGATARAATLGAATLLEPGLEEWIGRNVSFPNAMVDRITPATTAADRDYLARVYALNDRWPVVAEPYLQWVVEDTFAAGRPPWEDVGVRFTSDVQPYETLKLRLLNAGHSCLAYLAALAGHEYVHEVMADQAFRRFLHRFLDAEASPALPAVPGIDVERYKTQLMERFANPEVRDQVARLCIDGSSKFPKFLIPTVEAQLDHGGPIELAALAVAGWCEYLLGFDDSGGPLQIAHDPNLDRATSFARASRARPEAFLEYVDVLGARVGSHPGFSTAFTSALASLRGFGVHSTLQQWLNEGE